jgi:hypothetical protein
MAGARSPGLTSAARRPESIISVMPTTPHVERREASASIARRAHASQSVTISVRLAALRSPKG